MNENKRIEKDIIGSFELPPDALYGIHSYRAVSNFTDNNRFHEEWYRAIGMVKLACYRTYAGFSQAVQEKLAGRELPLRLIPEEIVKTLEMVAGEIAQGKYFDHFIVPAISGGAGTSINMNVNEIIANASLLKLNSSPGHYEIVDPFEHANIYQSTNDVIPTSLKVAAMFLLRELEMSVNATRAKMEELEKDNRNNLRLAYTQMQEAVPSSYGRLFGTYNEALSRDWWRVSKCFERIKVVNLGGSAVGTGITIPRYFIAAVVQHLQKITLLPVSRSENLTDATCNLDSFVEVHATLKAHAVNLEKMCSDLRLLAADVAGRNEIVMPARQAGSSIMPFKVNPVIPEYVISVAHKVYSNDQLISSLCGQGCLDLNAYLPLIGHALLESIKLLIGANTSLQKNLFSGLLVQAAIAKENLVRSPAIATALLPYTGYNKANLLAAEMKKNNLDIFEANRKLKIIDENKLQSVLSVENLLKEGFSLEDLLK